MTRSRATLIAALLIGGTFAATRLADAREARHASQGALDAPDLAAALPDGVLRRQFVLSCTPCHQLRLPPTGGRTVDEWLTVFQMMRQIDGPQQYGTRLITDFDDRRMAQWLVRSLQRSARPAAAPRDHAVVQEYAFGRHDGFYHDMEYAQGRAWSADFFGNVLYAVDPSSGAVESIPIPSPKDHAGPLGAHTINRTRDGALWITCLVTGQVARFDPATKQFTWYGGLDPHSHVHSFALGPYGYVAEDAQGRIWVTHFTEEYLSRLDPNTGAIERFALPHSTGFEPQQVHPYAVAMDRHGRLWYAKLQPNVLGMLDPSTRTTREWRMPRAWSGPRRLAIDTEDRLWIPEYTTNMLTVFDTQRARFTASYRLPSQGDYPYAVRQSEQTGALWITGTGTDSLYQFNPRDHVFHWYRLPSAVAYTRMITFDEAGNAWTVYGSFPNTFGPYASAVMVRVQPQEP